MSSFAGMSSSRMPAVPAALAARRIDPLRVKALNVTPVRAGGGYVLYWMQQSQRAEFHHSLEYAHQRARDLDQRLLVADNCVSPD